MDPAETAALAALVEAQRRVDEARAALHAARLRAERDDATQEDLDALSIAQQRLQHAFRCATEAASALREARAREPPP